MVVKERLHTYENARQICTLCGRNIPKDVQRISFHYRNQWGYSHHRICGKCILELSKALDLKSIREWEDKLMVDKL